MADNRPEFIEHDPTQLPAHLGLLIQQGRWVLWRYERDAKGKWTKVPYQPSGMKAENNNPNSWTSHQLAADTLRGSNGSFNGLGACLKDSEIAAFDLDKCRDPITGEVHPWAEQLVRDCNSYCEISVSGTGLRIIGLATGERFTGSLRMPSQEWELKFIARLLATLLSRAGFT